MESISMVGWIVAMGIIVWLLMILIDIRNTRQNQQRIDDLVRRAQENEQRREKLRNMREEM